VHWNGTRCTRVPAPNPMAYDILYAVSADSATDAWAVGSYTTPDQSNALALILHWNGTSWTQVPSPS
jgi:hypothetical protein